MPMPKTKEFFHRGSMAGADHVRSQLRDTAGRDDSGGDTLEDGAYLTFEQASDPARGIGGRGRGKHPGKEAAYRPIQQPQPRQTAPANTEHRIKAKLSDIRTQSAQVRTPREILKTAKQSKANSTPTLPHNTGRPLSERRTKRFHSPAARTLQRLEKGQKVFAHRRNTIKTVQRSAEKYLSATKRGVKTAERMVRNTPRMATGTARTAQAAAKAAAATARTAARVVSAVIRLLTAAVRNLVTAVMAVGWIALVIVAFVALVALLFSTAFGVFTADKTADGSRPLSEAVFSIDAAFRAEMDAKIAQLSTGEYDKVVIDYMDDSDGDSAFVNNWNDVLAVYAVLLTTDAANATDVATVTPEKIARLREIFYEMNEVSYDTEIVEEEAPTEQAPESADGSDGEAPERLTVLHIRVAVTSLDYRAAADHYRMNARQREVLDEIMSPAFAMLFAELVGIDVTDGLDLTQIVSGLPANAMGSEVVKAALMRLGAPYVLGAKGDTKFDCSGLVYWSILQVNPSLGRRLYTNAAGQAKYCSDNNLLVGESELRPGDLVFWQNLSCKGCHRWEEIHHTGIYLGNGKVIEASSGKGRVVIRDLWSSQNYPLCMFGRPY